MDHIQKGALKLILIAIGGMIIAFVLPLVVDVALKGMLFSYALAFLCPGFIIAAIFMLRNGERSDAILGPLGSEQRRRTAQRYGLLLAIPGLLMCVVLYFVLMQHGYRAPWDIGPHYPNMERQ